MSESTRRLPVTPAASTALPRLQSWKDIAVYFGRSVRTVQRWEARGGLPVYRLPGRLGSVYAYDGELGAWFNEHRTRLEPGEPARPSLGGGPARVTFLATARRGALLALLGLILPLAVRSAGPSPSKRVDPDVREAYLRGRFFLESPTEEETRKAIASFEQAIREDPAHAPALAGLARAYLAAGNLLIPTRQAMAPARAAALKALTLDPSLAEAYTTRGLLRAALDWDIPGSEGDLRRAVELDPGDARAHLYLGITLMLQDRREEGLAEIERAHQQDPLSLRINARLGMTYAFLGRYEQGLGQCQKALQLDKNSAEAHACMGYALERKGAYRNATREYERAGELGYRAAPQLARLLALTGQEAEARKRLSALQEGWRQRRVWSPYEIAKVCHTLGDDDETFAWLDEAFREHDPTLIALSVEPEWDGLRSDPRFVRLTQEIGVRTSKGAPPS